MDKRTRVLNALNKQPVDHVPCGFWFHFGGSEAKGDACVRAHLKYYRETDLDFIKIMCDSYFNYPLTVDVRKPADWKKLQPLGKDHPFIREQVERAKAIVDAIGDERCVFYNVFAPFSSIRFATDDDFVMESLREDPEALLYALNVIAQDNALLSELLITEAGCDGIYFCVQGGELDRFTVEEYHRLISPSELKVLEHVNKFSENNIMHCCGWAGAKNNLSIWKDYPVKCVNWAVHVEEVSLDEGRTLFGGKATLGGFKTLWDGKHREGIIYDGTKEELQEYTREMILFNGKCGRLIGGDCTIDGTLDWERIRWIVEAARSI